MKLCRERKYWTKKKIYEMTDKTDREIQRLSNQQKISVTIFCDSKWILITDCNHGNTIVKRKYYASILDRLGDTMKKKKRGRVCLLQDKIVTLTTAIIIEGCSKWLWTRAVRPSILQSPDPVTITCLKQKTKHICGRKYIHNNELQEAIVYFSVKFQTILSKV